MHTIKTAKSFLFIWLFVCSLLSYSTVNAQITGFVSSESDIAIDRAHIAVIGTDVGTVTDDNGFFKLDWKVFPIRVRITSLGFKPQVIVFDQPEYSLKIKLKEDLLGLGEVTVSTDRFYSPYNRERSIAKTTIDGVLIKKKSTTNAVDLLRAEPGVFVQQSSAGQGSVYIRGRAGRDVLYLFNGLRMNPAFVRSGQNQYFGAIDPFAIKQLDVFRGPVSVYYGSDALSGGINVSTNSKSFTTVETVGASFNSVANFGGTGEKTMNGQFSYQNSTLALEFGATGRDFSTYNLPGSSDQRLLFPYDESLEELDYNFYSLNFAGKVKLKANNDISVNSYYGIIPEAARIDRMTLGYSFLENNVTRPVSAYESNTDPLEFFAQSISYNWYPKTELVNSFKVRFGYHRLRDGRKTRDFLPGFEPFFILNPSSILSSNDFVVSDTSQVENNISNQYLLAIDAESNLSQTLILKWGADLSYDYITSTREIRDKSGSISNPLPRYPNGSVYIQSGIFAHLDHQVSKRLHFEYGVRYSYFYVDLPFEGVSSLRKFDPYDNDLDQLTASFSAALGLSRKTSLLFNLNNGFRAPNIADLSEVGIRRTDEFQIANIGLKPEKSINLDFGIRHSGEVFSTEIYAFWLYYFDRIRRTPTGNLVDENGQFIRRGVTSNSASEFVEVYSVNEDALEILGIEYVGRIRISDELNTGLTFTYNRGALLYESGAREPVDRIPPANGLFYIDYKHNSFLQIRPQVRYAFDQRRISLAEINDRRISPDGTDGFINYQLIVNLKFNYNLNFKLIADNLANSSYREHASALDGLRRNLSITASYTF